MTIAAPEGGPDLVARSSGLVCASPWLCEALELLHRDGPPGGYIAAGALRDAVWDALSGRATQGPGRDTDVVYFDRSEASGEERAHERRLERAIPGLRWEVTNQATVHRWASTIYSR